MRNHPSVLLSFAVALAIGGCSAAFSQELQPDRDASAAAELADGNIRESTVSIDGENLFAVRGFRAYPAQRRAREIAARIRAIAENPRIASDSLTIEERADMTLIMASGQRVMAVFDEDAALEEIRRQQLAEAYRARIREAIEEYRQARRQETLLLHAAYALVATVLLLLCAYAGRRIMKSLRSKLERRYRSRIAGLEHRSHQIVKVDQIWRTVRGVLNLLWGVGIAVMMYVYLNYVLALFPWTRGAGRNLSALAFDPLRTLGLGFLGIIPNLAFLAILTLVTRYALRIIRIVFDGLAAGTFKLEGFDPEWAIPTYRLVRILTIACAAIVAYPYIPGSDSGAFKGISLFMGIIFSLGSSSLIGNLIAGYSMTYRRAFRPGDRVKIGQYVGDVEQVRLLVTHLRTPKNEEVVVPNSMILGSEVVNYTSMARERGLILHTTVGIGYETPWRQVEAMLIEAAARSPGLRSDPPPFVLQTGLGDFCVTYEINVYCDKPQYMAALYTDLHRQILDVFNEYGVQIMTPAYEGDPEQPKVVPKAQWYAAPALPPEAGKATMSAESVR
jgi:small-conductance mechanosensitive channel